jgi:molybdopterin-synthase adenylyltransferase
MSEKLNKYKPRLRDGVDIYLESESDVTFVYLSSRKRIKIQCHPLLIKSLSWLTGEFSVEELNFRLINFSCENFLANNGFLEFIKYLYKKGILISEHWIEEIPLPCLYKKRLERQLTFLLDITDSSDKVARIQSKIYQAKIAIFGIGGVGSWLCRELVMMGFRNFLLVDYDIVSEFDISRHGFFEQKAIGLQKTEVAKQMILDIDQEAFVKVLDHALTIDSDLESLLLGIDCIINTADEPYIGYTGLKLSRYCVQHKKPLMIAGGFDAHLGSLGELIIPGATPCADCYNKFFKESLKDWKPISHPVKDRRSSFGGLASLSVLAASTAAMTILRYFIDPTATFEGERGELLFDDYDLSVFPIQKNPTCSICSNLDNER